MQSRPYVVATIRESGERVVFQRYARRAEAEATVAALCRHGLPAEVVAGAHDLGEGLVGRVVRVLLVPEDGQASAKHHVGVSVVEIRELGILVVMGMVNGGHRQSQLISVDVTTLVISQRPMLGDWRSV